MLPPGARRGLKSLPGFPCLQPRVNRTQKEKAHASCKTRNQAPRQTKKNTGPRQRLLPNQIQAVPFGQGSGRAWAEVRLLGTQAEEATVPLPLDCAHRGRRQAKRPELQPVHQRIEEERRGTGSQDSRRFGGKRSQRI